MDEVYAALVERVGQQVVDAVALVEELDGPEILRVDDVIRHLLRKVGERCTAGVFQLAGTRVVERAKSQGAVINRSSTITVCSLFGVFEMASPYLVNRDAAHWPRPVRDELGITHRMKTPALKRALTDFGIEDSFGVAAERFEEHYGWRLHRTCLLRVVEECASGAERFVADRVAAAPDVAWSWGVLLEMDGCELRTGEMGSPSPTQRTAVRGLPKRTRPSQWRDVRLAFARPLGGEDKTFVGGMSPFAEVVEQLHGAACHQGMGPGTFVAAVLDGGNGLREAIEARFGEVFCVLDRPHMSEHLHEVAKAMTLDDRTRFAWVTRILEYFYEGRVSTVFEELQRYAGPGKDRVDRFLKHLWRFQDAVDYGFAHFFGIPQGSGEIESAHRYIPQRRMKLPGATWHPRSINPILALRIVRANGWWKDFWDQRDQVAA